MKARPIVPGDTLGLVSPASPLTRDKVDFVRALFEEHGYKLKEYPHTFAADAYLAGTDEQRASDLKAAFFDPATAAVFCTRGGYGCSRLMPYLDFDEIVATRKLLFGFSDITVLHAAINRRGLPSVHAPMALTLHTRREGWVYESLLHTLRDADPIIDEAPKGKTLVGGKASGVVVGGCLILVTDLLGTPEEIDLAGKILILEDVDEAPHRVDAMLTQLINSGQLAKAAGIVVGEMTRTDTPERLDKGIGGRGWREIVADRLAPLGLPTVIEFPFGHNSNMLSLPLGIRAELDADRGVLTYLEKMCS